MLTSLIAGPFVLLLQDASGPLPGQLTIETPSQSGALPGTLDLAPQPDRPMLGVILGGREGSVAIESVQPDTGAQRAGLLAGDVLLRVGGIEVDSSADVVAQIALRRAGDELALTVLRGDRELEFVARLGAASAPPAAVRPLTALAPPAVPLPPGARVIVRGTESDQGSDGGPDGDSGERAFLGVSVEQGEGGLRITGLTAGAAAERGGLQAGDRLVAVDDHEVEDYDGLVERLGRLEPGDFVSLRIERDGESLTLLVELGARGDLGSRVPGQLRSEAPGGAPGAPRGRLLFTPGQPGRPGAGPPEGLRVQRDGNALRIELDGDLGEEFSDQLEVLLQGLGGLDGERFELHAEHMAEQAERFAEELSGRAERWAEEAEVWAEQWSEGMETWAEAFEEQSEVWGEALEAQSERLAERFGELDFDLDLDFGDFDLDLEDLGLQGLKFEALEGLEDLELDLEFNGRSLEELLQSGGEVRAEALQTQETVDENGRRVRVERRGTQAPDGSWTWEVIETEGDETGAEPPSGAQRMRAEGETDGRRIVETEAAPDPVQRQLDELRRELESLRRENERLRRELED